MHDRLKLWKVCARWVSRELKHRGQKKWTEWICPCNISYGMQMKKIRTTGLLLGTNHGCITINPNQSVLFCNRNGGAEVAETIFQRLICCGFRRNGKAMGQVYQCWWRICREINVFSRFEYLYFTFYNHLWPIYWISLEVYSSSSYSAKTVCQLVSTDEKISSQHNANWNCSGNQSTVTSLITFISAIIPSIYVLRNVISSMMN
jgi:hypothetical protein